MKVQVLPTINIYFLIYFRPRYTTYRRQGFKPPPRISISMSEKIDVFLINSTDPILGEVLGCDLRIIDQAATVADLMDALDEFAARHLADCKGCDGCCQERAPLLSVDIYALSALLPQPLPWLAHEVIERFGELRVEDGVSDIILRRDADSVCAQLERRKLCCTIWPYRPFVCRSHFCLPRSVFLETLRQDIANLGLNELTRLLLAEEAAGAPPIGGVALNEQLAESDYTPSAFTGKTDYAEIRLKDCVEPGLWQELCASRKG